MPKEIKDKFLKCPSGRKYYFIDTTSMSTRDICNLANEKDQKVREKAIMDRSIHDFSSEDTLKQAKMTFLEEFTAVCLFLFGVPGAAYTIPVIAAVLYYLAGPTVLIGYLTFLVVLSMLPAPFQEDSLWSYPAIAISKYFSFKGCFTQMLDRNRPYILVAPPHGLFPFGNLVTMIAFPCLAGFSFKGLAASAALRMPYFRQLLCTIGVIDASAKSATKALKDGYTIGISTGGVAEVFETNSATGDEAIVLRERKGLVKLAIRTGAPLVPSYLFGNTKLFSQYTGGDVGSPLHSFLEQLSRKIGFATVLFWGRFREYWLLCSSILMQFLVVLFISSAFFVLPLDDSFYVLP
jgi:hypothetical protein